MICDWIVKRLPFLSTALLIAPLVWDRLKQTSAGGAKSRFYDKFKHGTFHGSWLERNRGRGWTTPLIWGLWTGYLKKEQKSLQDHKDDRFYKMFWVVSSSSVHEHGTPGEQECKSACITCHCVPGNAWFEQIGYMQILETSNHKRRASHVENGCVTSPTEMAWQVPVFLIHCQYPQEIQAVLSQGRNRGWGGWTCDDFQELAWE